MIKQAYEIIQNDWGYIPCTTGPGLGRVEEGQGRAARATTR